MMASFSFRSGCLALLATLALPGLCDAQTAGVVPEKIDGAAPEKTFDGYLGAGAVLFPRYIGSASNEIWPVPLPSFEYKETLYIYLLRVGARLWSTEDKKMAIGIAAEPRFGFHANDGVRLSGMATRSHRIEGGPTFEWETPLVSLTIAYFTDWSGAGGGHSWRFSLFHQLIDDRRWDVGAYVGLDGTSSKTTQYYFGVRPEEATPERPFYQPGATLNSFVGFSAAYKFNNRYALMFGSTMSVLGPAAANSPIVERRNGLTSYIGLGWIL